MGCVGRQWVWAAWAGWVWVAALQWGVLAMHCVEE